MDATEFARKASQGLKRKRVLSKRLNIWLFEFTGEAIERGTKLNNLRLDSDTQFVQNNHLELTKVIQLIFLFGVQSMMHWEVREY